MTDDHTNVPPREMTTDRCGPREGPGRLRPRAAWPSSPGRVRRPRPPRPRRAGTGGRSRAGASDILTWITQLRNRVERTEVDGHSPIDFGYGTTVPAEQAVRTMLDNLSDPDGRRARAREWPVVMTRRLDLLKEFRRVREQIG